MSKITITPEMLNLVSAIDTFKGAWPHLPAVVNGKLEALRLRALSETVGSTLRFEGMTAHDGAIYTHIKTPHRTTKIKLHAEDISGLVKALSQIEHKPEAFVFFPETLQDIHKSILQFSSLNDPEFAINEQLDGLIRWTRDQFTEATIHPLLITGIFLVVFLSVDPYQAGQIRLAYCLNHLLMRMGGYDFVAYGSLVKLFEEDKNTFTSALLATQSTLSQREPNYTPWLLFFLKKVKDLAQELADQVASMDTPTVSVPYLTQQVTFLLKTHGQLSIGQIEAITGTNRNTIKKTLARMCHAQSLLKEGSGRATSYKLLTQDTSVATKSWF